jgi:prevent-host-death family protein
MATNMIGITDLRQNAKNVVDRLRTHPDQAMVIVSRSKPVAVLMRPELLEALEDRIDELEATVAILTREHDMQPLDVALKEALGE